MSNKAFEEWIEAKRPDISKNKSKYVWALRSYNACQDAFSAGQRQMNERCAEIAMNLTGFPNDYHPAHNRRIKYSRGYVQERIANAIRKEVKP